MFWSSRFTQDSCLDYWWSVSMAYIAATVKDMMTMHDFFLFYFIKWYISLNVPEKKGVGWGWEGLGCAWGNDGSAIGGTTDGRKHKSNNIEFPDRWAISHFNYLFLILSILLSLPPSYLLSLSPPKDKSSWWVCLFYTPLIMEDGASWSDRAHPIQEMGFVN